MLNVLLAVALRVLFLLLQVDLLHPATLPVLMFREVPRPTLRVLDELLRFHSALLAGAAWSVATSAAVRASSTLHARRLRKHQLDARLREGVIARKVGRQIVQRSKVSVRHRDLWDALLIILPSSVVLRDHVKHVLLVSTELLVLREHTVECSAMEFVLRLQLKGALERRPSKPVAPELFIRLAQSQVSLREQLGSRP